ncbi:MAG TPA: hypothetical protein VMZ30_00665 [Pyrinomonadaceae bacterium]|nr:hypothetical protein [Pyrinomonadaceae bacterium]
MSEVKLNLVEMDRVFHGTIHGSVVDACIAALSAEPETVAELEAALARYIKPCDANSCFASFHSEMFSTRYGSPSDEVETAASLRSAFDIEPWDAGIVVIDFAARIVASESSYSQLDPEGEVFYHDGEALTDMPVLYRVPQDWLFVTSVDAWQWSRQRRISERTANPVVDARPILFGRPLLQFVVNACRSLPKHPLVVSGPQVGLTATDDDALAKQISAIHARWLLTPRDDLCGKSPRDVLLAHQDQIDFDLHTRSLQWSLQHEGPPCLSINSFAYRFAGFGTHEYVLYYDLIRHLIGGLIDLLPPATVSSSCAPPDDGQLIATLNQMKTEWLESPQADFGGRIPAILIDNERKRLPQAMRARDMIIDDDCPMCQMFGDETTPLGMGVGFWHLDGAHMDDDFAFSTYKTRQEWENENRRREEFDREFNRKWEERQQRIARGEPIEPDPFFDPEPFELELE